jgi:hypothetical protein
MLKISIYLSVVLFSVLTVHGISSAIALHSVLKFRILHRPDVLQFNEEEHKAIYDPLQDLPKHSVFLSRFRIFCSQADEKDLDFANKRGLQQSMNLHGIKLDELSNKCKQSAITNIYQLIQSHKAVLIFAPGRYHPHQC